MALADWSTVAANNATTLGVNIGEGCPPSNVNDAIRKAMADVASGINVSLLGTFLSSTTLANARTALGVQESSTSANNFNALTNAANKLPYMTGTDGWATTDFTSFARTLVASGDGASFLTALGVTVTTNANGTALKIPASGHNYYIQFAVGSYSSSESTQTVTWPVAFTTTCLFASVGTQLSGASIGGDWEMQLVSTSTTGCTVQNQQMANGTVTTSVRPTVIAIGY